MRFRAYDTDAFFAAGSGTALEDARSDLPDETGRLRLRRRSRVLRGVVAAVLIPMALLVIFLAAMEVARVCVSGRRSMVPATRAELVHVVAPPLTAATPSSVTTATPSSPPAIETRTLPVANSAHAKVRHVVRKTAPPHGRTGSVTGGSEAFSGATGHLLRSHGSLRL
jgi:hypothetical protein